MQTGLVACDKVHLKLIKSCLYRGYIPDVLLLERLCMLESSNAQEKAELRPVALCRSNALPPDKCRNCQAILLLKRCASSFKEAAVARDPVMACALEHETQISAH